MGRRDRGREGVGEWVAVGRWGLAARWRRVVSIGRWEVGRFSVGGAEELVDEVDEDLEGNAPLLGGGAGAEGEAAHHMREGSDDGDAGCGDVRVHVHPAVCLLQVDLAQEDAGIGVLDAERVYGVEQADEGEAKDAWDEVRHDGTVVDGEGNGSPVVARVRGAPRSCVRRCLYLTLPSGCIFC